MTKKELTFMPKLICEYELIDFDILPKNYAQFLTECAQIYVDQSYPDLKKDDKFFRPNFNLLGKIEYSHPDNQTIEYIPPDTKTEHNPTGIYKSPSYWQNLGEENHLNINQLDFELKVQEIAQQMNTLLDQRFPQREGKFPKTYIKELDLSSESIELYTSIRYDMLPLHLFVSLKADGGTMQDMWKKKYHLIQMPRLILTLTDDCTAYSKLESIMENMEFALKKSYDFERKKTTKEYTERKTVELDEKRRLQEVKAA